ncbi:hypothetical protein GSI_10908 [Ganoderma sinense ZZ0214-1]|uniref:F-box domain-containing protein n=1 Tax=Ganoderma sinense ZZ0214-1 TaxID=1077348 RepID=A0A2G8S1W3_9APHY|nr:hypothetical protein GSI_10908 [Ganoderma sinense ZZ0214-1]
MRGQNSLRYPVELWESVIDYCNDPGLRPRVNYPALRACALVCRNWRSRSQFNLLQAVAFSKASQVDLLLQTIELRPPFADCIHSIAIDDNADGYIPFAHPSLRRLRACMKLDVAAVDWTKYPPTTLDLIPLFTGITDLSLSFDHLAYSAAFRVVWTIPGLRTLAITGVGKKPIRGTIGESLGALALRRKPNVCVELKTLLINEPFLSLVDGFPPRGAFGEAITCIQLQVSRRHGISETMRRFIYGGLPQLDSLQISISEGPRPKGYGLGHTFTGLSSVIPRPGDVFRGRVLHLSLPFDSSYGASRTEFLNILHEALLARAQCEIGKEPETEGCFHCNHASTRVDLHPVD